MDAVKYLKTKNRMTKGCMEICNRCELYKDNNGRNVICDEFEFDYPEEAVEKVRKWDEAHPIKTCAQVFFERFPDAPKDEFNGKSPKPCPSDCFKGVEQLCGDQCVECWNQKAPDEYQDWADSSC